MRAILCSRLTTIVCVVATAAGCSGDPLAAASAPVIPWELVQTYPHDRGAFTQGLDYVDGLFYEGTGLYGQSSVREVNPATGQSKKRFDLDDSVFGEGIVVAGDRIVQLTWQSNVGFVYDKDTFMPESSFQYDHEGWGITFDGTHFIVSDGSWKLRFWDSEDFKEIRSVDVKDGTRPIRNLNELEYVDGAVFANVWKTDLICRIDPQTGQVTGWIDLKGLLSEADRAQPVDVLNGIAYNEEDDTYFVTGKLWPKVFEIRLLPEPSDQDSGS